MKGGARVAGAILLWLCWLGRGPASATVLDISPRVAVGVADSKLYGQPDDPAIGTGRLEFGTFVLNTGLTNNGGRVANRFGYAFTLTRYPQAPELNSTGHTGLVSSTINIDGHTTMSLLANASVFKTTNIGFISPYTAGTIPTMPSVAAAATELFNLSASENLAYQATGRDRWLQSLSAAYSSSISGPPLPEVLTVGAGVRRDRIAGKDTYSLAVTAGEFFRLDPAKDPTTAYLNGSVISTQVLAGWRRDYSARLSTELQGGVVAFYGIQTHSVAMAPAGSATLSYQLVPWFATLTVSQSPSVNVYAPEALITDAVTLRLALPLTKRGNLLLSGLGGYAYSRRVTAEEHFAVATRVFDTLSFGASLAYLFERLPITVALDYSNYSVRGSQTDLSSYPSTARSFLALSVAGAFGFGEGNFGWLRTR
ncbi:MAG TPA: hypothetical protein VGL59_14230 [Polyangia bacterium]|jgi:hypothetical protein